MDVSILSLRAQAAESLLKRTGENYFPFTHPEYPHQAWLTEKRRIASENAHLSVPADPFEQGVAGGLSLWERAATPTPWTEFMAMSATRVPAFRKTNTTWLNETIPAFYRVGTVQNGEILRRPQSPAIIDLMSESWGWRLLEAAHALAHRAEVQERFRPQGFGLYGSKTVNWVARLAAAMVYDIPVDVSGLPPPATVEEALESNDGFYRYGISICDSNNFQAPFLRVPCIGKSAPVPERDLAFLAVGVYIEPHPKGFTEGTGKWLEVNRWACSPTMVSIAGWELADVIYNQQPNIAHGSTRPEFTIAAPALMPYDKLNEFIEAAKAARGEAKADNVRYWNVRDWLFGSLGSQNFRELIAAAPPLPCRDCLRLNMRAEGAPGRPQSQPPKEKPDRNSKYLTREEREWLEWDGRIDQVFDIIEKSVIYYESRMYGNAEAKRRRSARRKEANVRKNTFAKIASLTKKADRAFKKGIPSVGIQLMNEVKALQAKVKNGIITTNENSKVENQA